MSQLCRPRLHLYEPTPHEPTTSRPASSTALVRFSRSPSTSSIAASSDIEVHRHKWPPGFKFTTAHDAGERGYAAGRRCAHPLARPRCVGRPHSCYPSCHPSSAMLDDNLDNASAAWLDTSGRYSPKCFTYNNGLHAFISIPLCIL